MQHYTFYENKLYFTMRHKKQFLYCHQCALSHYLSSTVYVRVRLTQTKSFVLEDHLETLSPPSMEGLDTFVEVSTFQSCFICLAPYYDLLRFHPCISHSEA